MDLPLNITISTITQTAVTQLKGLGTIQWVLLILCLIAFFWLLIKMFEFGIKAVVYGVGLAILGYFIKVILTFSK